MVTPSLLRGQPLMSGEPAFLLDYSTCTTHFPPIQTDETTRKDHGAQIRHFDKHAQARTPGANELAGYVAATAASFRDKVSLSLTSHTVSLQKDPTPPRAQTQAPHTTVWGGGFLKTRMTSVITCAREYLD